VWNPNGTVSLGRKLESEVNVHFSLSLTFGILLRLNGRQTTIDEDNDGDFIEAVGGEISMLNKGR
jgi:hypothetical protein